MNLLDLKSIDNSIPVEIDNTKNKFENKSDKIDFFEYISSFDIDKQDYNKQNNSTNDFNNSNYQTQQSNLSNPSDIADNSSKYQENLYSDNLDRNIKNPDEENGKDVKVDRNVLDILNKSKIDGSLKSKSNLKNPQQNPTKKSSKDTNFNENYILSELKLQNRENVIKKNLDTNNFSFVKLSEKNPLSNMDNSLSNVDSKEGLKPNSKNLVKSLSTGLLNQNELSMLSNIANKDNKKIDINPKNLNNTNQQQNQNANVTDAKVENKSSKTNIRPENIFNPMFGLLNSKEMKNSSLKKDILSDKGTSEITDGTNINSKSANKLNTDLKVFSKQSVLKNNISNDREFKSDIQNNSGLNFINEKSNSSEFQKASDVLSSQFAKKFSQNIGGEILTEAKMFNGINGTKDIKLIIKPEELGTVRINLKFSENNIDAKIFVSNELTKSAIENSVNSLVESLQKGGLSLNSIEVSSGGADNNHSSEKEKEQSNKKVKNIISDIEEIASKFDITIDGTVNITV